MAGALVGGNGSLVRNNQVFDTVGSPLEIGIAYGIYVGNGTDVIGNTISGVTSPGENTVTYGIFAVASPNASIRENRIKGVFGTGTGGGRPIYADESERIIVRDNDIQGTGNVNDVAIFCSSSRGSTGGNFISGFPLALQNCTSFGDAINDL